MEELVAQQNGVRHCENDDEVDSDRKQLPIKHQQRTMSWCRSPQTAPGTHHVPHAQELVERRRAGKETQHERQSVDARGDPSALEMGEEISVELKHPKRTYPYTHVSRAAIE